MVAVWTMATINGDGVREVMSQETPTSCIQVPMSDTTLAIQSVLKKDLDNGLHVDEGFFSLEVMCAGRLFHRVPTLSISEIGEKLKLLSK